MVGVAWTAIGLLAATLGVLTTALFQLRGEIRSDLGGLQSEIRSEIGGLQSEIRSEIGELRREMREGFHAQGVRIDVLASRIDAHVDRHAG